MLNVEATNTNFIVFGLTHEGLYQISTTLQVSILIITPPIWFNCRSDATVCEISSRPIDNVYVKSNWSMSNIQNFVYNVQ